MTARQRVIANPLISIGVKLVAAALAIWFVLEFTKMTIRMRAHARTVAATGKA